MSNDMDVNQEAVRERSAAVDRGQVPVARDCWDRDDLASWFRSFSLAAGYGRDRAKAYEADQTEWRS